MRKFIVYSQNASTAPVIRDLKSAGRIDILLHSIISALFASNEFRDDVELHLILMGPPNAPRHITLRYNEENSISKKNLKKLIELALRKYREGKTNEIHPGVFVDNKTIEILLEEFKESEVFVLDFAGSHIKEYSKDKLENGVFILGDHDGFEKKIRKYLKKNCNRLSLGNQIYFTSQAITIINYELDNL
jgi:tRNA (pseudouridine54-N1)-methyltransferase